MQMKLKLLGLFMLCIYISTAQSNMISNSSFETYSVCPNNAGQFENNVQNWYNPNISSPDYFNACCTTGCIGTNVPNAAVGYQNAKSGNAFVGMLAFQQPDGREYIGTQLISPMIFGHKYYCEMYLSLGDIMRYAISRIGFHFSNSQITQNDYYVINVVPQVENPLGVFLSSQTNWMKVSGSFIASGGEQWLTIGNFYNDLNTDTLFVTNTNHIYAYYYIDDVSVIDSTAIGISEHEKQNAKLSVFPNPATNEISIEFSEVKKGILFIKNLNGSIVLTENFETKTLTLDVSSLQAGVYFAEAVLADGKRLRQRVIKLAD